MSSLLGFGHMSFMFMNGTATCFLALALLAWKGSFAGLPLLCVYAAGAVGGTLAVGLMLKPKEAVVLR